MAEDNLRNFPRKKNDKKLIGSGCGNFLSVLAPTTANATNFFVVVIDHLGQLNQVFHHLQ